MTTFKRFGLSLYAVRDVTVASIHPGSIGASLQAQKDFSGFQSFLRLIASIRQFPIRWHGLELYMLQ